MLFLLLVGLENIIITNNKRKRKNATENIILIIVGER
jgi:hypothetical protein